MSRKFILMICALALPIALCAQDAAKQPASILTTVGDVTDNRTTGAFNAECKIELKFTGDAAADASSVRTVRAKKAVDDQGRDLVMKDDDDHFFNSFNSRHRGAGLTAELKLRNPSRNASVIKLIEGEVELFNPTPANGGVLVIKDILKHPAEPVQDATLKKYRVEVVYLTKESYNAKKKQAQAEQKGGDLGDLFSGMFEGMMSSDSKNSVKLYVKDPDKRVIDMEFQDSNGKSLKRRSSWSSNEMRSQDFDSPPPADTQLMIHLATPEAVKVLPFKLENVALP